MKQNICIVGGDKRMRYAAARLEKRIGLKVKQIGLTEDETAFPEMSCDIMILPMPASRDGITIDAPFGGILPETLIPCAKPGALVFGGKISAAMRKQFAEAGLEPLDYLEREELCVGNAVPTAEGAIQIAMAETDGVINRTKALILGFGRIGKALASRLQGLGVMAAVCARRPESRAEAEAAGCRAITPEELFKEAADYDVLYNTVPAMILDETVLKKLSPSALVIDLASKPGGTDFEAAKKFGIRVVWALSLPADGRH